MGCRYTFQCPACGYKAEVSGEGDAGFFAETTTIVCHDCRELLDIATAYHGEEANRKASPFRCPKGKNIELRNGRRVGSAVNAARSWRTRAWFPCGIEARQIPGRRNSLARRPSIRLNFGAQVDMAQLLKKYSTPPIIEAVCEIHFAVESPLGRQLQVQLQPIWKDDYPQQKFVDEQQVRLQVSPEAVSTETRKGGTRLICRSADGQRLVQISGEFLAVNQLRPYPGWEEGFRDLILRRAVDFEKVVGAIPFKALVLRYINKIDIPQVPLVWQQWFKPALPVPQLQDSRTVSYQMQFVMGLPGECRLEIVIVSLPATESFSPVILDLSVIWSGSGAPLQALAEFLERVHDPHRLAFEEYLSDNLRTLFNQTGKSA